MKYPCKAPGCKKESQTCMCMSCEEPWLYEFCSRECWNTVDIVDHLRAESDMLSTIAAEQIEYHKEEIEYLWEKNEKQTQRIENMEGTIQKLIDAFGVKAVNDVLIL